MTPTITDKDIDKDIENIVTKYNNLVTRLDAYKQNKAKIDAVRDTYKQSLKKVMDEAKKIDVDPDKIREELQRAYEVLALKVEVFGTEIEEGENIMRPMLKEIQGLS
jgi:septation ring formation regulator EzrA